VACQEHFPPSSLTDDPFYLAVGLLMTHRLDDNNYFA